MPTRKLPSRSSSSIALEPEAAIAIIGLFSAAADGEGISSTEENALSEMLEGITVFDDYTEEDFEALSEKIASLIEQTKPEELIASAIASLPNEDYREAAYVTALIVTAIDEDLPEEEDDYLYELQEALNISDERANEIIDEIFGEEDDEYEEEEEE
ncbi:MAG TPA: tellurite resistance TerB family protein [Nostocaceae cyanobacterium]|nr:tellurite resistance TerB family protein [Nostocaceae cyanobacterium]